MRLLNERLKPYDGPLLILAALMVGLYVAAAGGNFPLDDSWIHQVYGRNLAQTGQWAFVPGQPSAASTSPLYTVVLALGYVLHVPYNLWPHLVGALALFITGATGARMAEHLAPKQRWIGWLTGVVLVIAWHLVWAAAAGMETMLFAMLTLGLIALAWRQDEAAAGWPDLIRRGVLFGGLAGLATLTRPEGVLLAGLIGLTVLLVRPWHGLSGALIWGAAAGIGFGVMIAPYLLLNLRLTGGLLPNTAAAKQAQVIGILTTESLPQRLVDMIEPLAAGGQLLLVPGMVWFAVLVIRALRDDRRKWFDLLLLIWPAALVVLYAARLPAPYQHGRYVIPMLPALLVAGMVGSMGLVERAHRSLLARAASRALLASALLVFVYFGLLAGRFTYARDVRIIDEEMVTAAHWIADHIPPSDLLAIHDIGAVGYFAPRPILDIAGLVSPEVIPLIGDTDGLWQFMQARGARYLMAFPDQAPGGNIADPRLCPVFTTHHPTAIEAGGDNMTVYALAWDGDCEERGNG